MVFADIRRQPGERPAILIVDLLSGKDVRAAVEQFRSQQPALADVPDERIVTVRRDAQLKPEDMPALHRELRDAAARLLKMGTDRIHYFHAGPAAVAALVGAEFANGACVMFYQYGSGSYANFGPIRPVVSAE